MAAVENPSKNSHKSKQKKHLPGEEGVWVFIFGDMMIFSLFFLVFLYYRNLDIDLFVSSQALLNQNLGALNTVLLLTSSWFVALGLHAVREARARFAFNAFRLAFVCGLGFGFIKYIEWGAKIREGYTLTSNDFFMYYYIFTGVHLLHVIIGMGVLVFLILKAKNGQCSSADIQAYESGGAYWHMVDLLWIVLFPLLYLVR